MRREHPFRSLSVLVLAAAPLTSQNPPARDVDLDHVILSTPSLAWGIAEFTRLTGVVPKRGGQHPGVGTENALISLGSGHYLELLAPVVPRTDTTRLQAFLRTVGYQAEVRAGGTAVRRLTIACPKGQVVFSSERP